VDESVLLAAGPDVVLRTPADVTRCVAALIS
jgi:hypothetical protein